MVSKTSAQYLWCFRCVDQTLTQSLLDGFSSNLNFWTKWNHENIYLIFHEYTLFLAQISIFSIIYWKIKLWAPSILRHNLKIEVWRAHQHIKINIWTIRKMSKEDVSNRTFSEVTSSTRPILTNPGPRGTRQKEYFRF